MNPRRILGIGFLALIIICVAASNQRYVASGCALFPLILLAAGQFMYPVTNRAVEVSFNPEVVSAVLGNPPEGGYPVWQLSGHSLNYSYFKQRLEFKIVPRVFPFILIAGFSLGCFWTVWQLKTDLFIDFDGFYFGILGWVIFTSLAFRWVWERYILSRQGVSMAPFEIVATERKILRDIRYSFVDHQGQHRGGILRSLLLSRDDDLTLVFYDERDPERSVPAAAMIFHRIVWKTKNSPVAI